MSEDDELDDVRKAVAEINAYFQELRGESARAAAVLAVASLDDELERLILSKFPRTITRKIWKEIAGPAKPLGPFKARNDIAHAFGFYGRQTRATLDIVSTVRNKFAHERDIRTFDHPIVRECCKKLATNTISPFVCSARTHPDEIREGFLGLVEALELRLEKIRLHLPELGGPPPAPLP